LDPILINPFQEKGSLQGRRSVGIGFTSAVSLEHYPHPIVRQELNLLLVRTKSNLKQSVGIWNIAIDDLIVFIQAQEPTLLIHTQRFQTNVISIL
jgi:hypothetical protein